MLLVLVPLSIAGSARSRYAARNRCKMALNDDQVESNSRESDQTQVVGRRKVTESFGEGIFERIGIGILASSICNGSRAYEMSSVAGFARC